ncbi:helix-turn-helix domain-containing protein [Taibaiella helva]|uniref:helix-turn-helix domain-containing protein n=1 Tax=Taibaiella helva TaxID=2301235 RepID=UPI000E5831D0|nr:pentapeptide repeat-containing protein [Taibaiella helva]
MEAKIMGNKIAGARKEKNMSQAQLAEQLFISPQAVGKWERGESIPDILTFSRLAEILGVDLNYFSENFPSAVAEKTFAADQQTAALTPAKQEKKLSWDMSRGNWVDADFSGLKNLHEKFSSSNMQRCRFIGSVLSGLLLKRNNVDSCDFSGSDFSNSHIQASHLSGNIFTDCSWKEVTFLESYASGCDFSGADFTGAKIRSGGIEKCNMLHAILNHTSFNAVQLADIIFEGTLEDCAFENCAFTRVTFRNATLINTFFKCRSLKRIRFIDSQVDRMTYAFLKNGNANLEGITLLST